MKNALPARHKRPHPIKARLLRLSVTGLSRLPLGLARGFGSTLGRLAFLTARESRRVADQNLALAFPDYSEPARRALVRSCLRAGGALFGEAGQAILGAREAIESRFSRVQGKQLLDNARAGQRPVIVLTPHIGNWEFLWFYLQLNYPAMGFYREPKMRELAAWLRASRGRFGGQTLGLTTAGLRGCIKGLREGRLLVLLPDQVPVEGAGVFAPFFGHTAYTMTLLQRLAQSTDARLLMASCLRAPGGTFVVRLEPFEGQPDLADPVAFATQLNQNIERVITACPEQYQWHYKRYKVQPDGISLHG